MTRKLIKKITLDYGRLVFVVVVFFLFFFEDAYKGETNE